MVLWIFLFLSVVREKLVQYVLAYGSGGIDGRCKKRVVLSRETEAGFPAGWGSLWNHTPACVVPTMACPSRARLTECAITSHGISTLGFLSKSQFFIWSLTLQHARQSPPPPLSDASCRFTTRCYYYYFLVAGRTSGCEHRQATGEKGRGLDRQLFPLPYISCVLRMLRTIVFVLVRVEPEPRDPCAWTSKSYRDIRVD